MRDLLLRRFYFFSDSDLENWLVHPDGTMDQAESGLPPKSTPRMLLRQGRPHPLRLW